MSPAFVGFIIVALVGAAAEMAVAFSAARKDRLDMSVSIALGSASQIALLVAPVLVLISLRLSLVPELGRLGTNDLADHLARYAKLPANRLDRLTMNKISPTDLRNRLHHQHPNLGFHDLMEATVDPCPGVPIGCRSPRIRGPYSMPKHRQSSTSIIRIRSLRRRPVALPVVRFPPFSRTITRVARQQVRSRVTH